MYLNVENYSYYKRNFNCSMYGDLLMPVMKHRYLGILINHKLSSHLHISQLCHKANQLLVFYNTQKNFGRGQIWQIVSPKFSSQYSQIHAQKMYMAYALTVAYSPNLAFTCMVCQNIPHQIFPVYGVPKFKN